MSILTITLGEGKGRKMNPQLRLHSVVVSCFFMLPSFCGEDGVGRLVKGDETFLLNPRYRLYRFILLEGDTQKLLFAHYALSLPD